MAYEKGEKHDANIIYGALPRATLESRRRRNERIRMRVIEQRPNGTVLVEMDEDEWKIATQGMTDNLSVVTCDLRIASCRCTKPAGHVEAGDDVHACDAGCGGSWTGDNEDTFMPVTFPSGIGTGLPVDRP